MQPDKKISNLRKELSRWIELRKKDVDEAINDKNMTALSIAIAYFDLAHGKLANDEIDEARELFHDGTIALISEGSVKKDVHIDVFGNGHTFPIYGYLGGRHELGKPVAKRYLDDFRTEMARPGYLSPAQRIFEDFYFLLGQLVLEDLNEINKMIQSLDKRLSKFKIGDSLYKPTGLYHKYPLFGKEMVKAILNRDDQKFSENISHWSQLALNVRSPNDSPKALTMIQLVLLYDLALGKGMRPKIETPFIPKSIVENGYWNKPS